LSSEEEIKKEEKKDEEEEIKEKEVEVDISDIDTGTTLGKLTAEGRKLSKILHEYQSVIPKLIQVKGDDSDKDKLYNKNLKLLDPQVTKMRDLFKFHEKK